MVELLDDGTASRSEISEATPPRFVENSVKMTSEKKSKKTTKTKKKSVSKSPTKKSSKKKVKIEPNLTEEQTQVNEQPVKKKRKTQSSDKSKKVKAEKSTEKNDLVSNGLEDNSAESLGHFSRFRISERTQELLRKKGISYLFPIQLKSFDYVYDGKDVVAQARTGTGKTMSFALPLVEKLNNSEIKKVHGRPPKVLVMAPTRELASQVHNDFKSISQSLSSVCIYGGTPYYTQESAMRSGLDIVVGTPGRILDHINKGNLRLHLCDHVVLDEVDQMLDMGFAPTVEEILQYAYTEERSKPPQTLLFSATCPAWVEKTAKKYMRPDETVRVDTIGQSTMRTATTVEHLAIRCHYSERAGCIGDVIQFYSGQHGRAMVFTDTKKEANELAMSDALRMHKAQVMHGDIEQRQREITLKAYRNGNVRCLVATNVAARGLDIPEVDLVIQTSPPQDIDSYIHRSGRTGRAGRTGVCVCFYKPNEDGYITKVERTAGLKFKRIGAPQPKDLLKASVSDAVTSIESVDKKIVKEFMESAQTIADKLKGGPVEALAAALAYMAGASKLHSRSLLNSQQNRTTWVFKTSFTINHGGFVFTSLEKYISRNIRDCCQDLRITADGMGAVFDLPDECTAEVEELWRDSDTFSLKQAETLPELQEKRGWGGNSNGWGGQNNRGGFRRSNGGGGFNKGSSNNWGKGSRNGGFKRKWGDR